MIRAAGLPGTFASRSRIRVTRSSLSKCRRDRERRLRPLPVRVEEMRQSGRIVKQALEGMPAGVEGGCPQVVLPDREKMKTQMEALIYHFKIVTKGFAFRRRSVSGGGIAARRDGLLRGERWHLQAVSRVHPWPSFGNLQGLPEMVEGRLVSDAIAALGSTDFVLGDVDR